MNIFVDDLEYEEMDFTIYYNEDGEPEMIEEMEEEQITNHIVELRRQMKLLPEHYNIDIWETYLERFREALQQK